MRGTLRCAFHGVCMRVSVRLPGTRALSARDLLLLPLLRIFLSLCLLEVDHGAMPQDYAVVQSRVTSAAAA
jgi:hypothetical protein